MNPRRLPGGGRGPVHHFDWIPAFAGMTALAIGLILFIFPRPLNADTKSQRYLRNAIHYYQAGDYEKSKGYFIAVVASGTSKEAAIAKRYLAKQSLQRTGRQKIRVRPVIRSTPKHTPATSEPDSLLEDQDVAPERERPMGDLAELPFQVSGFIREEVNVRLSDPQIMSKLRTTGLLAATGALNENISYKASGRAWYDAVYDLTNHYPDSVGDDQRTDLMWRDTYVDVSYGPWDLRTGKQQIVWGEAAGLFYADVVNAKDLREFIPPDLEFVRIPEWGMDLEYTWKDFHAEGVWLPFPEMDRTARPGSEYQSPSAVPAAGGQVQFAHEQKPGRSLTNSQYGGRLSYRAGSLDIGVFQMRSWDKSPVYIRTIQPGGTVVFTPTHPRLTISGFTFAFDINDIIFKGELAYFKDRFFQSINPIYPTGVVAKDYADYLLGIDYVFPNKVSSTLQVGQRYMKDFESGLPGQKKLHTNISLSARDQWLHEKLEPEFLIMQDVDFGDRLIHPRMSYKFDSQWKATIGAHFFSGSSESFFGQFSNRDRGYFELQFNF